MCELFDLSFRAPLDASPDSGQSFVVDTSLPSWPHLTFETA
jgi:hypothetical protein